MHDAQPTVVLRAFVSDGLKPDNCDCVADVVRAVGWPHVTGRLHSETCPVTDEALTAVAIGGVL